MLKKIASQRGDTIVEVLISVAVVGLILGAGFIGANRAYDDIQDAQYHQIATSIAQTQLELLNSYDLSTVTIGNGGACFVNTGTPTNPTYTLIMGASYSTQCISSGAYNFGGYAQGYGVDITDITPPGSPAPILKTYQVDVSWPGNVPGVPGDTKLFYQTKGSS
ncbi:MAG TPA: type II secretion system protein [Candidatus Saccharimonadales bacterium]